MKPLDAYRQRTAYIICDAIYEAFPDLRLRVVDVGSDFFKNRNNWHHYGFDRLTVHVFDLDPEFCTYKQGLPANADVRFYKYAVSDSDAPLTIYLPNNPINGSRFRFNAEGTKYSGYSGQPFDMQEVRSVDLPAIGLDQWRAQYAVGELDYLKMNIQGGELAALQGGAGVADSVVAVEIEMSLSQTYLDAPLFSDIDPVLRRAGFEFFDLLAPNVCGFLQTPVRFQPSQDLLMWRGWRSKIFEGHFLYFRDPLARIENRTMPADKILRLACAAEVYGHVEYAFALLSFLIDRETARAETFRQILNRSVQLYVQAFGAAQ